MQGDGGYGTFCGTIAGFTFAPNLIFDELSNDFKFMLYSGENTGAIEVLSLNFDEKVFD